MDIKPELKQIISHNESFNHEDFKLTNSELDPLQSTVVFQEEEKPFQCLICGQTFDVLKCLKRHMTLDHIYQCNSCERKFPKKIQLKRHFESLHLVKTLKCNTCKLIFDTQSNLDLHIESVHEVNNQNFCRICNKEYYRCNIMRMNVSFVMT